MHTYKHYDHVCVAWSTQHIIVNKLLKWCHHVSGIHFNAIVLIFIYIKIIAVNAPGTHVFFLHFLNLHENIAK